MADTPKENVVVILCFPGEKTLKKQGEILWKWNLLLSSNL